MPAICLFLHLHKYNFLIYRNLFTFSLNSIRFIVKVLKFVFAKKGHFLLRPPPKKKSGKEERIRGKEGKAEEMRWGGVKRRGMDERGDGQEG